MRCARAQELIVLIPSGDASPAEARRVADHIEHCSACRQLAAAEPLPFASLRTTPPLREADYAAVRARVVSGLQQDRRHLPWISPFRLAAATAVLVVAAGLGLLLMRPQVPGKSQTVAVVDQTPDQTTEQTRPSAAVDPQPEAAEEVERHAAVPRIETAIPAAPAPGPDPSPPDPSSALAALEPAEELHIQLQTSDPDVRIIWILNPIVEFEPIFPEEKS